MVSADITRLHRIRALLAEPRTAERFVREALDACEEMIRMAGAEHMSHRISACMLAHRRAEAALSIIDGVGQ